jgi:hypothetical protein
MKKLFLSIILTTLFVWSITAQEILTTVEQQIKDIEEYGIAANGFTGSSDYSPESTTWDSLFNAPEPFGRSIGGKIGDYVYIFGGQANNSMAVAYNIPTNTWVASTICTDPAYNAAFCVTNTDLYKLSGTGAVTTFEKFTPDGSGTGTWSVLAGGSTDIMNAQNTMAWDGGDNIYVHSSNYSTTSPASYLSRYSISGNSWINLTPTTLIKRYAGLQFFNGILYLIGGLVPIGGDQMACAKYDPTTDTWSSIASLPEAVNFCKWSTTKVPSYIVLVGSGGGYTTYPSNPKIFYYDPVTDTWTYDSDTPEERGLALGFFMPGLAKLFFGGGNMGGSSSNYQTDCWDGDATFIPVELVSFSTFVTGNSVQLNWQTATETNNSGFAIERSRDNATFSQVGFVPGFGTTTEPKSYSYTDNLVQSGIYYYRLRQVDYDGSTEYSNTIEAEISNPQKFELVQNYPNPFNPSTTIKFTIPEKEFVSLKVYDVMGNEVSVLLNEEKEDGTHTIEFNASNLASGTYFYKLQAGNFIEIKKMLLLK